MKILIIEDEQAMSDLIAIKFKVEGFEVDQVATLTQARNKLATDILYNAILADYLLPDGDLVDFLTQVRTNVKNKDLPIVVMTNYIEDVNTDKLKSLGVKEVIVKYQVVPAQMVEKVKQLVHG